MRVLDANQNFFLEKYGISLQKEFDDYPGAEYIDKATAIYLSDHDYDICKLKEEIANKLLVIFLGSINKKFWEDIITCNHLAATEYIVYEKDAKEFLELCCYQNISTVSDNKVEFVVDGITGNKDICDLIKEKITYENRKHIAVVDIYTSNNHKADYDHVRKCIEETIKEVELAASAYRMFGSRPCENELYALSVLSENYSFNTFLKRINDKNIPVILIGAGPSLRKNAGVLKKAKGKALLITCSHALRFLKEAGVEPDLVAEIDPMSESDFYSAEYKGYMLISSHASREVQEKNKQRCIYYGFDKEIFKINCLAEIPSLEDFSGSVMTEVFELFCRAGFKKYIFAGMDLAFSENGSSHCIFDDTENTFPNIKVKGCSGDDVDSREDWIRFREYYEKELCLNPDIEVIDGTEGGALIEGSRVMSLSDAIIESCTINYPFVESFDGMPKAISLDDAQNINENLKSYLNKFIELKPLLQQQIRDNRRIQSVFRSTGKLDDYNKRICTQYDEGFRIIMEAPYSKLMIFYFEGLLQDYLEDHLLYECDEKVVDKLKQEEKLFEILIEHFHELIEYISGII